MDQPGRRLEYLACRNGLYAFVGWCFIWCFLVLASGCAASNNPGKKVNHPHNEQGACRQLVVLGDPHLPGPTLASKEQVLQTINAWHDVDLVVAVGDICSASGRLDEYAAARDYFATLRHNYRLITGNHDFQYADIPDAEGKFRRASFGEGRDKLERFRLTFHMSELSGSQEMNGYLLIFLSGEDHNALVGLTGNQLIWLDNALTHHAGLPTLIFFHAPLQGTLRHYRPWVNQPHTVAQPVDQIHSLLERHPQVFLWVSGHTHTTPEEESFASAINLYDNRVTNLHNAALTREQNWTNALWLCPGQVIIRTYDHQENAWLPALERYLTPPERVMPLQP